MKIFVCRVSHKIKELTICSSMDIDNLVGILYFMLCGHHFGTSCEELSCVPPPLIKSKPSSIPGMSKSCFFFKKKKKTFPTRLGKACPPIFPSTQKQQNFRCFSVFCRQGEASSWAMLPAKPFGFLVLFRLPH